MAGVSSRYRIVRRLGQGGMAEVFEGELLGELGFVRRVAIKQLLPDALRDPMAARRFVDETRIASRLHHANVVAVLDVGMLDDRPFQVLELVDGLDAHALVQRAGGRLPVELALMLAHAVAHALDHAHTATDAEGRPLGIVHRDVKPPNVLVAWSGDVKLADFGIAVAHDRVAHTETGSVAGTRGFIAPEQRTRAQLDGRSDVFALGLTLHALCTGATPLSDVMAEARLLGGEPLALDPALPEDVRALIAAAVAPDRRDRPTAATLAQTIGAALAARGGRDARSAVRDYVSGFRTPPRRPGALDMLLGVELVPVAASDGTVQRYATEAVAFERAAGEVRVVSGGVGDARGGVGDARGGAGDAPADAVVPDDAQVHADALGRDDASDAAADGAPRLATSSTATARHAPVRGLLPAAPPRRGFRLLAFAATSAAVVAVFVLLLLRAAPAPAARAPIAIDVPVAATSDAGGAIASMNARALPSDAGVPSDGDASAADVVAAAPPGVPVRAHVGDSHRPPDRTRPSRNHAPPAPAVPAAAPTAAPAGHGYVQVVGEELLRARVLIDGVAVGYVPNRFEVALGHHRVEVERPDGVRLPPRELDVTSFHTAKNPARPSW
ncbi:MAG: serine/threonine-protein kinase [Kofleriaceae bacterium]